MNEKKIVVKYQFYEVCCLDSGRETELLYDLSDWGNRVACLTLEEKIKVANGIIGRLENRAYVGSHNQYEAYNFMRLDEVSNTYKVKQNMHAEHIDLEEDEYIGKNTVVLYDPRNHVAMVQCNRGGYGISGIVSYINQFNHTTCNCYFRPIYNIFEEEMYRNRITKIDVRFANTRQFAVENSKCLERILESCNEMESLTAHIEIGLGYTRGKSLNSNTISEVVDDLRNPINRHSVKSARIVLNDDVRSSIFDLFDNIDHENIIYSIPPRAELGFEMMAWRMAERYEEESRVRIVNNLRNGQ